MYVKLGYINYYYFFVQKVSNPSPICADLSDTSVERLENIPTSDQLGLGLGF